MDLRVVQALRACPLYFILDITVCGTRGPVEAGVQALAAGVTMLQLRLKGLKESELATVARDLKARGPQTDWLLIVNDSLDAAVEGGADGVHLGENDLPVAKARQLAKQLIIGATARYARDAYDAEREGADYIGCGSVFPSPTKPGLPVIGVSGLGAVASSVMIPVVAIGGINSTNAKEVLAAGAQGFCSIAPFSGAPHIGTAVRQFLAEIDVEGNRDGN